MDIMEFYESDDEDEDANDECDHIAIQRRKSERIKEENLEDMQKFFQKWNWN